MVTLKNKINYSVKKLGLGHYYLITAALAIAVLLFLTAKGCQKSKSNLQTIVRLRAERDSIRSLELAAKHSSNLSKRAYRDSLEIANGLLALREDQLLATSSQLDVSLKAVQTLLKERKKVSPSDTSTTLVPNEYMHECEDCWRNLESQNRLVIQYKRDVEARDSLSLDISQIHAKRVLKLEEEKQEAVAISDGYKKLAEEPMKEAKPKRMMYLTLGIMGMKQELIIGGGGGLMYQDKHKRAYGAAIYGTTQGPLGTANIILPLSFK